jgi:hypothetical protein
VEVARSRSLTWLMARSFSMKTSVLVMVGSGR